MIIEHCFYGLNRRGDSGFIAYSPGITVADKWVVGDMVRIPALQAGFDGTVCVYPLDGDRVAVQYTREDKDRTQRRWPFCHILVFRREEYETIGANPFLLLRSGFFRNTVEAEGKIGALAWTAGRLAEPEVDWDRLAGGVWQSLLDALLGQKRTYVFLDADLFAQRNLAMETLLHALPVRQRSKVSFCTSLSSPEEKSERLLDLPEEATEHPPSFYQTGFNLVFSGRHPFNVPDSETYLEINGGQCVNLETISHPFAILFARWLETGMDAGQWSDLLQEPSLCDCDNESASTFFNVFLKIAETPPIAVDELARACESYAALNRQVDFFSRRVADILLYWTDELEALDDDRRKKLAAMMHRELLHVQFLKKLLEWAENAENEEFFAFFKWYCKGVCLETEWLKKFAFIRLQALHAKSDADGREEFSFWMDTGDEEECCFWAREFLSESRNQPASLHCSGPWLLNHLDDVRSAFKMDRQTPACADSVCWEILLEHADENGNEPAVERLVDFFIDDVTDERLAMPDRWPRPILARLKRNPRRFTPILTKLFDTQTKTVHLAFLEHSIHLHPEMQETLVNQWFYFAFTKDRLKNDLKKLVVDAFFQRDMDFKKWFREASFDKLKWLPFVVKHETPECHLLNWFDCCLQNRLEDVLVASLLRLPGKFYSPVWSVVRPVLERDRGFASRVKRKLENANGKENVYWLDRISQAGILSRHPIPLQSRRKASGHSPKSGVPIQPKPAPLSTSQTHGAPSIQRETTQNTSGRASMAAANQRACTFPTTSSADDHADKWRHWASRAFTLLVLALLAGSLFLASDLFRRNRAIVGFATDADMSASENGLLCNDDLYATRNSLLRYSLAVAERTCKVIFSYAQIFIHMPAFNLEMAYYNQQRGDLREALLLAEKARAAISDSDAIMVQEVDQLIERLKMDLTATGLPVSEE